MNRRLMAGIAVLAVTAAGSAAASTPLPVFVVPGSVERMTYDGITDDLLSAGLNLAGLISAVPPGFADPNNPTPAELRRRAIYENYRGIVDPVPAGGMGLLWGPGSMGAPAFDPPVVPGLIPGIEYKAFFRVQGAHGHVNTVGMVVQIPAHFDPDQPCIVSAPPSGSRGYYGGIAAGEWGLFKGCAVVLGGKGSGTGFHLLGDDHAAYAVNDLDGVYAATADVGQKAQFRVKDGGPLRDFLASHPDRVATKHAHSEINPEVRWGNFAIKAIRFAFWALNDHFETDRDTRFKQENTLVIATGVSNGAGVSIRSVEADRRGWIDGLVVTEPNANPREDAFVIRFGSDPGFAPDGRTLYDDITAMGTFASCAALDPSLQGTPFAKCLPMLPLGFPTETNFENRCQALHQNGLLASPTLAGQASEALGILRANGYYQEADWGLSSHECLNLWRSLQPTYAAAYGRFAVWENVCDVSFAATDAFGAPMPVPEAAARALFATSSGIPATAGINLIADDAANGPILENLAQSRSTGLADLNGDGALCFRYLGTGDPSVLPRPMTAKDEESRRRVRRGLNQMQTTGDLHGTPALIVHGREDALVFPNTHSRAYYALNRIVEGAASRLSYIEVTPAQHFDTFISRLWPLRPDFTFGPVEFVPLHYYLTVGLDMMYDHLKTGAPLPPSQVVRATPRGTEAYTAANVPALLPLPSLAPAVGDRITFAAGVLSIPD